MIRFILGGLLFVVAALAVIFQDPLLIAGAGILLLIVLITFIVGARDKRRKNRPKSTTTSEGKELDPKQQDLRAHGILEVRPVGEESSISSIAKPVIDTEPDINSSFAQEKSVEVDETPLESSIGPPSDKLIDDIGLNDEPEWKREDRGEIVDPGVEDLLDDSWIKVDPTIEKVETSSELEPVEGFSNELKLDSEFDGVEESQGDGVSQNGISVAVEPTGTVAGDLVRPFLESVRTASSASTLCLLRIDKTRREFRVLDILSESPLVRRSARFPYESYFLADFSGTDTLRIQVSDRAITGTDLGYYSESVSLADLVVCPIMMDNELVAHLLADVADGDEPFNSDEFDILESSGKLLGEMLSVHGGFQIREELEPIGDYIPAEPLRLVTLSSDEPYNMIIEEEVNRARMTESSLALALIHVQTPEDETLDEDLVAEIEHLMRKDLEKVDGTGRVERVGEMAFGVFIRGHVEDVEEWINQAQYHFAMSKYEIPGEVIIGAACLSDIHQSSEAFRVSAGQAFKEAYETGENTILVS